MKQFQIEIMTRSGISLRCITYERSFADAVEYAKAWATEQEMKCGNYEQFYVTYVVQILD